MTENRKLKDILFSLYQTRIPLNVVLLLIVLIFFFTIFIGFFFFSRMYFGTDEQVINASPRTAEEPVIINEREVGEIVVLLYTMDGVHLEKEQLQVALSSESHQRYREIIQLFIRGPYNKRFQDFYSEVEVKSMFVQDDILIVNLSENFPAKFENASLNTTIVHLYSLINTLLINIPDVQGVQILIEGTPQQTLNGWIDISVPLLLNQSIIRE